MAERDVIRSYFETRERAQKIRQVEQAEQPAELPADAKMKVLSILLDQTAGREGVQLQELQESTRLGFADFGAAIAALQRAGLIELRGDPGREVCVLTDSGRALVAS